MKIIQLNTVPNGCTGRIAFSLKKVLEENGHECMIAYGRGTSDAAGTYRISGTAETYMHVALTRVFDTCGLHSRAATQRFLRTLDEYRPDVLHLHLLHGYYINYPMLFDYLKKHSEIRVFWTMHDCWAFTGHCPYYTYAECDRWKTGCHDCPQKLHHPTSYVFDRSMKNYEDKKAAFCSPENMTIITPSAWLKEEVEQSFLGKYRVVHIPNGIHMESFHPTDGRFRHENGLDNQTMILGVANMWAATKGMDYFIRLLDILPQDKYAIVLVGLSAQQKSALPQGIIGIEHTENLEQLVDIYSSADIFINPTLEDNFPTTNIEALACGTPVVTFDSGGSPEALDSTCGFVVEKSAEALAQICERMGRKTDEMIAACLKRAQLFDEDICFGRYLSLYCEK